MPSVRLRRRPFAAAEIFGTTTAAFVRWRFPAGESRRLVLSQSPGKPDLWKGRGVVHLADSNALKPDPSTMVMTLDYIEIASLIAPNDMDDDYDILQKEGCNIKPQFRERQEEKMKAKYNGRSE
ncbi:hypothetical protein LY76DRAFT_637457 [Colletotrichum caudatum]|nr:hypothetical protein LY76DRAFT_637457 [Colletotrichum caudatum]